MVGVTTVLKMNWLYFHLTLIAETQNLTGTAGVETEAK